MLILLRGAIDNITVSCLSSGINDSCELCEGQDLDDKRTTMTIPSHQQHRDDDVIRMANGTASILRDILLQRQIHTAKKNDKVSSSIEVMLHQSRYNACMEEAALTLTSLWRMIVRFVAQDGVASQQSATSNDSNTVAGAAASAAANCGRNSDNKNNDERVIVTIVEEFVLPSLDVGRGVKLNVIRKFLRHHQDYYYLPCIAGLSSVYSYFYEFLRNHSSTLTRRQRHGC